MLILLRLVHPPNVFEPMLITLFGRVISFKAEQPQNASLSKNVTLSGMVTVCKPGIAEKGIYTDIADMISLTSRK